MLRMSGALPLLPLFAFMDCIGTFTAFLLDNKVCELLMRRRVVWYIGTDISEYVGTYIPNYTASQFS